MEKLYSSFPFLSSCKFPAANLQNYSCICKLLMLFRYHHFSYLEIYTSNFRFPVQKGNRCLINQISLTTGTLTCCRSGCSSRTFCTGSCTSCRNVSYFAVRTGGCSATHFVLTGITNYNSQLLFLKFKAFASNGKKIETNICHSFH